jgi:hypothetical protein
MFGGKGSLPPWSEDGELLCPTCGAEVLEFGESRDVVVHPDRDEYDSPIGSRGGWTSFDIYCHGCGWFSLVIAQHKGSIVARLVPRPSERVVLNGIEQWSTERPPSLNAEVPD